MGRRTLLLIAAFIVAALGTTLVFLYVNGVNDRALADQNPVEVLVAKTEIPQGMTGADARQQAKFDVKKVSKGSVAEGALGDDASIQDKVALAPIFPGEQILASKFGTSSQTSRLVVPNDKLAVSVAVNDPNRLGPFLTPGSHVVIFLTTPRAGGTVGVLLPDVEVIASGEQTLTSGSDSKGGALLTLAVDQLQAQKVILGSKTGDLYFALRNKDAKINTIDSGLTQSQIAP